jgi:hypothetical protein
MASTSNIRAQESSIPHCTTRLADNIHYNFNPENLQEVEALFAPSKLGYLYNVTEILHRAPNERDVGSVSLSEEAIDYSFDLGL